MYFRLKEGENHVNVSNTKPVPRPWTHKSAPRPLTHQEAWQELTATPRPPVYNEPIVTLDPCLIDLISSRTKRCTVTAKNVGHVKRKFVLPRVT